MMNSDPIHMPPLTAKLELNWETVATRLTIKMYFDAGAEVDRAIDEFVIRHALREVLVDLLSTSFVSTKETCYPNSRQRMDLTIGPANCPVDFAIELKSTSASVNLLVEDWKTMLLFNSGFCVSILAGIVSTQRFDRLNGVLQRTDGNLGGGNQAQQIAGDFFLLSTDTLKRPADETKQQVSFVYIWHIGNSSNPLPNIGYHLLPS